MLTFRWKYEKLKQIEGSWNAWDIFTDDFRAKETEAYIVKLSVFFKGQHD